MKKWMLLLALATAAFFSSCGGASSGKVLVDINGNKITEGDLKFLGEINPRIQTQIDNPAGRQRILENLVEQELMYEKALKEGINRDPKVKAKIDLYRRVIIAQALVEDATEKAAKKYYDEHQDEFKKLKMSHLMVKFATPDEIKNAKKGEALLSEEAALKKTEELKARIDKGEDFAKVAEQASDDAATKTRGGDLGLISKDDKRLEARGFGPLLAKAFEMKVGEISGPIKTDKGYHLIAITRGVELEPYDEAKQAVLFRVRSDVRNDLLAKLKKDAKVVYPGEEKAKAEAKKTESSGAKKPDMPKPPEGPAAPLPVPPADGEAAPSAPTPAPPATLAPKPAGVVRVTPPATTSMKLGEPKKTGPVKLDKAVPTSKAQEKPKAH